MGALALRNGISFFKRLISGGNFEHRKDVCLQTMSGSRVMVVDDSPTICAVLGKMLGQDGYTVTKAPDGESAIELARNELPALIFLDIVLPGINGFSVLRTLRQDPLTRHIPIVMISGNPQATEQFYVQRFGADDFIKKPFGRAEVSACIDQLVRSGRLAARDIAFEQMLAFAMLHDVKPGSLQSLAI
jgi:DNA-binding response OmpR family regulator